MAITSQLRDKLKPGSFMIVPGCYDCFGARAIARHGFEAAYISGGSLSASLGFPDYGLITMTESADAAGRIARSVAIPVFADVDTGFGVEYNVIRTVEEFERRGVSGVQIEDQEFGKLCGHLDGKRLIPLEAYVQKIRAASLARENKNFVIVARIDAIAVNGFDDAIRRGNAALEAGADLIFVEAPETEEQVRKIPKSINGPCLLNVIKNSKTPEFSFSEIKAMGYTIALLPGVQMRSTIEGMNTSLLQVKNTDRIPTQMGVLTPVEIMSVMGGDRWDKMGALLREKESAQGGMD